MPGHKAPEDQRRADLLRAAYRVASRDRLGGLTSRAVAEEAGVSNGLVFFHFKNREGLILALLDRLLETTVAAATTVAPDDAADAATPAVRFLRAVERDVARLPAQRTRVALLVDFWVMGTQHPGVQAKIRAALEAYRGAYLPLAAAAIASEPDRYAGVTPEGLAAVATGFVEGCALQLVIDPDRFDVEASTATLYALVLRG